ncbi:MAG TPA: alpha/beta hydrolase [Nitrososphaeraceae archaeon]|nr:alpha/beta hydrolase [Nitrososphaeraceae archaeon]
MNLRLVFIILCLLVLLAQNSMTAESAFPDNTTVKKVTVGDIDVGYKILGSGKPLLLIPGFSMTMDMWSPLMIEKLSENRTVILFDNRGMGSTVATSKDNKNYSIEQLANDTAAVVDGLNIGKPVDVLGLSMGGFIAQELALLHPQTVNKLIIFASSCGGNYAIPPQVSPKAMRGMLNGNATEEEFLSTLFPEKWIQDNMEYIKSNIVSPVGKVSQEILHEQANANLKWQGTCDRLSHLKTPTLVLTGTSDITSPPANSLAMAQRIPGAWLVQLSGGGHGVMFQYPETVSKIINLFLSNAN